MNLLIQLRVTSSLLGQRNAKNMCETWRPQYPKTLLLYHTVHLLPKSPDEQLY